MGQVILIKNNKGGVGKSWISLQLAAYKASLGIKTCILTSDPQNNILTFSGKRTKEIHYLSELLQDNTKSLYEIRENLFFIPAKTAQLRVDEIE
ncbi:hypothetical protein FUSO7_13215, partial [Fusobacterium necrophorum BFTR-2]